MFFLLKQYNLNGIPPEILMDAYTTELETFTSWFTDYTNRNLIQQVFDHLFEAKYLKKDGKGNKFWSLEEN
ncbi:MAG: hypothetical protein KQI35_01245 [Bacteroidetes bacterium]|nr:hypothetical protein [Bacteroidota bacterium]